MSKPEAKEILKQNGQYSTLKQIAILQLLIDSAKAFSLSEVVDRLSLSIDRATVYRTLKNFEDRGLVVRMIASNGVGYYMFNHEAHCGQMHPHLQCKTCRKVLCLPNFPNAYVNMLNNYSIKGIPFLVDGFCKQCMPE